MSVLRLASLSLAALGTILVLWWNVGIHKTPLPGSTLEREHVEAILQDLGPRIHGTLPSRMQALFPEGAAFSYALYGLVNCNVAAWATAGREHLLEEAQWSADRLSSDDVRGGFPALLPPGHGIFHAGWSALLNGRILEAFGPASSDSSSIARFEFQCDTIAATFRHSRSLFPESYNGMAWPADGAVAMAALAVHDRILEPRYQADIQAWVQRSRAALSEAGGLPHAWDPTTNTVQRPSRGSSMALMCVVLADVDSSFAQEQFAVFRDHFFAERFGVPIIREYPNGHLGAGDVDSGPLVLGAGPVAMIVGAGACRVHGDAFHEHEMSSTTDGFGFPMGLDERRYLFGAMPIADLFIAWCRSMPVQQVYTHKPPRFLRFHLWSALLVVLIWSPWVIRKIRIKRRTE
jgi:hypothetical protein